MATNYHIASWGQTDIGLKRSNNEDSFQINDESGYYVVADGMGGEAAGEVASQLFIDSVEKMQKNDALRSTGEAVQLIEQAFADANARILDYVQQHPDCEGMGCTAELLTINREGFVVGHVGDSRTYRQRGGHLQQLTKDHSLVQQQLDEGLISLKESWKHPLQNVILRAVGIEENIAVDIVRGKIISGDQLLLCSDGLSDVVATSSIAQTLQSGSKPQTKVEQLIDLAKESGGNDNITVVLIEVQ